MAALRGRFPRRPTGAPSPTPPYRGPILRGPILCAPSPAGPGAGPPLGVGPRCPFGAQTGPHPVILAVAGAGRSGRTALVGKWPEAAQTWTLAERSAPPSGPISDSRSEAPWRLVVLGAMPPRCGASTHGRVRPVTCHMSSPPSATTRGPFCRRASPAPTQMLLIALDWHPPGARPGCWAIRQ